MNGKSPAATWDVVIAEPVAGYQQTLITQLQSCGHRVRLAGDLVDLLRACQEQAPDVVLLGPTLAAAHNGQVPLLVRGMTPGSVVAGPAEEIATALPEGSFDGIVPNSCDFEAFQQMARRAAMTPNGREVSSQQNSFDLPVTDMDAALTRMGGSRELLSDLIRFFFEDAFEIHARLRSAVQFGNREEACRAAHSLKGLTSNFNAARAVAALQTIENCKPGGEPSLRDQLCTVDQHLAHVVVALADYMQTIST